MWVFNTIKGRAIAVLVAFLSLSQLAGLWLYVLKSEEATALLHEALLAEQIALIIRVAERLPAAERARMLDMLGGPTVRMAQAPSAALGEAPPEGSRAHAFEHFLGVLLDRTTHEGIRVAYSPGDHTAGKANLLQAVQGSRYSHANHLPAQPLADIKPIGAVAAEITLSDTTWLRFAAPLMTVTPFSPWKIGPPLAAMLASVLLIAAWVLHRWTQPLTQFTAAAERFGTDVQAPSLAERGPFEVRTAAHTFNLMQERIRRLVEDRTALAAAIAHDLGSPITRLQLRVHEIEDETMRDRMSSDLDQMRRMIAATLAFARSDVTTEQGSTFDLASLIQSICDDLADFGHDAAVRGPARLTVCSKPLGLRRVLSNLIENAVKYGGRARIEFAESDNSVAVHITDQGPGIPDHLKEEAFRPFRRLLPPDSLIAGTGLGLTIARSIARALRGDVVLSNGPGRRSPGNRHASPAIPGPPARRVRCRGDTLQTDDASVGAASGRSG